MSRIETRLKALGITLPTAPAPVANYLGTKQVGELLFVSGRKSEMIGAVGKDVTEKDAKAAARHTMLVMLAIIKKDIGDLDRIHSVVKLQGFIRSGADFTGQPGILDGASNLLVELWGKQGYHARTATGTSQLPFGATLQLDMILKMKS